MNGILGFILASLQQVPALIAAGTEIVSHVNETRAAVAAMVAENRGPSEAEWAALHARIASLLGELDA